MYKILVTVVEIFFADVMNPFAVAASRQGQFNGVVTVPPMNQPYNPGPYNTVAAPVQMAAPMFQQPQQIPQQNGGFARRNPPPAKIFANMIVDMRVRGHSEGGVLKHISEDVDAEVITLAYDPPTRPLGTDNLQHNAKMERVFPIWVKSGENLEQNHRRSKEIGPLLSLDCTDAEWQQLVQLLRQRSAELNLRGRQVYTESLVAMHADASASNPPAAPQQGAQTGDMAQLIAMMTQLTQVFVANESRKKPRTADLGPAPAPDQVGTG